MKIKEFISSIENSHTMATVLVIFSWIFLRIFFEGILEGSHRIGYTGFSCRAVIMYFLHFPLFYLSTFLLVTILISVLIREDILKVTKVNSLGLGLIILVPLIDFIICGGCFITYPSRLEKYFFHFLNPFVSLLDIGVSAGQRIVIFLVCLFAGLYGFIKSKKILSGVALFFIVLIAILFSGGLTTIIAGNQPELMFTTGGILSSDTQKFTAIYLCFFIVIFFLFLYFLNKADFSLLISSMRAERMAFYGSLGIFGFLLAKRGSDMFLKFDLFNFLGIFFIFLCPAFGFWVLQILNDFFDIRIDAISRPRNPILKGISKSYYSFAGLSFFIVTLIIALILNYQAFLVIFTFLLLGVLYSVPPVRLKRLPFISTFILAVAVILVIAFGYCVVYSEFSFGKIPQSLILAILTGVTLGFSAKDINDIEGDKKNGVITLPVLFYRNKRLFDRLPLSLIMSSGFLFAGFFIPEVLAGSIIVFFVTFLYTVLNKNPEEWFYFLILYLFGGFLLISLLF